MPVYPKGRDKSGQKQWRVVIWHKGKRHDWIVTGKKSDGTSFEAERRMALRAGDPLDTRTAPLFSVFCTGAYSDRARVHLRESTRNVRKYQLATLIAFFGNLKLTEIDEASVEAFKIQRRERAS